MAVKTFTNEQLTASDTNTYLANSGLVYVTSTTVGSAVSSVTVSNCFSSTYDNYRVVYSNGTGSVATGVSLKLGSSTNGVYSITIYGGYSAGGPSIVRDSNTASVTYAGAMSTVYAGLVGNINMPYAATRSTFFFEYNEYTTTGNAGFTSGFVDNTTSFTSFTLAPSSGTLTGGTITVFGLRKA